MSLSPPFVPGAEIIFKAWALDIPGVPAGAVATSLPRDSSSWAENGFISYTVVGGTPNADSPMRAPVFEVDAYAVTPTSGKPPWGKANQLLEIVCQHVYKNADVHAGGRLVDPGTNYRKARVHSAMVTSEPRRIRSDEGSYARFTMDMQLFYTILP